MTVRPTAVLILAAIGLLALGLSGCSEDPVTNTSSSGSEDFSSAQVDTPELRAQKATAGIEQCPVVSSTDGSGGMPDITLPCLGGGPDVDLANLRGPAVINVWATWCGPCRSEAPLFQRAHEHLGDELAVIGIDYQEPQPDKAISFADELGLSYPQLSDPHALIKPDLRINGLPRTLFVDANGKIVYDKAGPLDSEEELTELISSHLGVADDGSKTS